MKPIIVSFATEGTPYEKDLAKLVQTCHAHGYETKTYSAPNLGRWELNCAQKPKVILQAMESQPSDVLFLDADCWMMQPPPFFETVQERAISMSAQIVPASSIRPPMNAIRMRKYAAVSRVGGMINSGVLFIANTQPMRNFVRQWVAQCEANPDVWDQITLLKLVNGCEGGLGFTPLPADHRAGGTYIGHASGAHRHWLRSEPQKWLLIGSAPYARDWWSKYGHRYVDAGFVIAGMNHAWEIPGNDLNVWLRPDDYKRSNDSVPQGEGFYEFPDGWTTKPMWEKQVRLSFVDICYHLMNHLALSGKTIELHVAGSDFVYPKDGHTHFYGRGGPDPLRYGFDALDAALARLQVAFKKQRCIIVNASDQAETRLPFDRHILGRF